MSSAKTPARTPAQTPPPEAGAEQPQQPQQAERTPKPQGRRQQKIGRVTSDKMQKTIVVAVEELKRHRIYKRTYKYTTKFKAHDERNDARIGDIVRIEETRPLSKEKRWRLVEIVKRAVQVKPLEKALQELDSTPEGETH